MRRQKEEPQTIPTSQFLGIDSTSNYLVLLLEELFSHSQSINSSNDDAPRY
jgi:hypothetical protein